MVPRSGEIPEVCVQWTTNGDGQGTLQLAIVLSEPSQGCQDHSHDGHESRVSVNIIPPVFCCRKNFSQDFFVALQCPYLDKSTQRKKIPINPQQISLKHLQINFPIKILTEKLKVSLNLNGKFLFVHEKCSYSVGKSVIRRLGTF
jgi:hypothetical protein